MTQMNLLQQYHPRSQRVELKRPNGKYIACITLWPLCSASYGLGSAAFGPAKGQRANCREVCPKPRLIATLASNNISFVAQWLNCSATAFKYYPVYTLLHSYSNVLPSQNTFVLSLIQPLLTNSTYTMSTIE